MFSGYSIIKVFKNVKFEIKVYLERKNYRKRKSEIWEMEDN